MTQGRVKSNIWTLHIGISYITYKHLLKLLYSRVALCKGNPFRITHGCNYLVDIIDDLHGKSEFLLILVEVI